MAVVYIKDYLTEYYPNHPLLRKLPMLTRRNHGRYPPPIRDQEAQPVVDYQLDAIVEQPLP
jgi:hypothetical protein